MEKIAVWPIPYSTLATFSSYFGSISGSQSGIYLKRLTNEAFGRLQAFRMYGSIGMSAPSLYT